jgi:hypothetical protein
MKILQGQLKEVRYDYPDKELVDSGCPAPPNIKKTTLLIENEESYITSKSKLIFFLYKELKQLKILWDCIKWSIRIHTILQCLFICTLRQLESAMFSTKSLENVKTETCVFKFHTRINQYVPEATLRCLTGVLGYPNWENFTLKYITFLIVLNRLFPLTV